MSCFKSQVREQEELKARPQNQKSFTCTDSLLGCSNPSRSAGREKCVLSASLPGSSEITLVDFSGFQQDGATNVFGPQCENSQQGIKFIKINLSAFQHFLTKWSTERRAVPTKNRWFFLPKYITSKEILSPDKNVSVFISRDYSTVTEQGLGWPVSSTTGWDWTT